MNRHHATISTSTASTSSTISNPSNSAKAADIKQIVARLQRLLSAVPPQISLLGSHLRGEYQKASSEDIDPLMRGFDNLAEGCQGSFSYTLGHPTADALSKWGLWTYGIVDTYLVATQYEALQVQLTESFLAGYDEIMSRSGGMLNTIVNPALMSGALAEEAIMSQLDPFLNGIAKQSLVIESWRTASKPVRTEQLASEAQAVFMAFCDGYRGKSKE